MSKLKTITIAGISVVTLLILSILIYTSTRPDTVRYERTAKINSPPEKIFALIHDFHSWGLWSPWEKVDPAMKRTFSGAENGKGAIYEWEGNNDIGKGRMEIVEAVSPSKIVIQLDFLEPFEARNTAEFTLVTKGDTTQITWAMYGPNEFISKIMCIFFDMDEMIGKEFETGLNHLKTITEKK
ncbi:SRPBCC family protein [Leptospira sp. WS92.C1]